MIRQLAAKPIEVVALKEEFFVFFQEKKTIQVLSPML
jgi:hypothetical protein